MKNYFLFALAMGTSLAMGACSGATNSHIGAGSSNDTNVGGDPAFGSFSLGGQTINRVAQLPITMTPDQQTAVTNIFNGFYANPITDFRTQDAAQLAIGPTLTDPNNGTAIQLATAAILRPGLGNGMFSPAYAFVIAQQFGTLIVMHSNMTDTAGPVGLRQVYALDGDNGPVNIPAEIADHVRIFELGSAADNIISWEQQSDVTLEQMEILHENSATLGFDALTDKPWIFAHSQGGPDVTLSQLRLQATGFAGFGNVITISSAILGGRFEGTQTDAGFLSAAGAAIGQQGTDALNDLVMPTTQARWANYLNIPAGYTEQGISAALAPTVTFAFGGIVDKSQPQGNVRKALWDIADNPDYYGQTPPSDTQVNLDSESTGRFPQEMFPQADHIDIIEDPALARQVLRAIYLEPQAGYSQ